MKDVDRLCGIITFRVTAALGQIRSFDDARQTGQAMVLARIALDRWVLCQAHNWSDQWC